MFLFLLLLLLLLVIIIIIILRKNPLLKVYLKLEATGPRRVTLLSVSYFILGEYNFNIH